MSLGEDSGSAVDFSISRGRDFPTIRQFTVFLENRVGVLLGLIRRFRGSKVRINAISIVDSSECCIVRFVFSHPEQGREIIERAGLAMIESDLIAVELKESEQPLIELCSALLRAEVNLIQASPLMVANPRRNLVGIMVDNLDTAQHALEQHGFKLVSEEELKEMC
jgi:hypothetical protein